MVKPRDHSTLVKDGRSKRVVLGRRFREADRLVLLPDPSLIAGNADLIPDLNDIFGLFAHDAFLLSAPSSVVPKTSGTDKVVRLPRLTPDASGFR